MHLQQHQQFFFQAFCSFLARQVCVKRYISQVVSPPTKTVISSITMNHRKFKLIVMFQFLAPMVPGFIIGSPLKGPARTTRSRHPNSSLSAVTPEFDEVCDTTGITLTRFMHEVERVNPELQELAQLFSGIQTASKAITNLVKRSQLPSSSLLGMEGAINVQGEDQKVCMIWMFSVMAFYTYFHCAYQFGNNILRIISSSLALC